MKGKAGKFPDHRGRATWGERLVPLERFRDAAAASGRSLSSGQREKATRAFLQGPPEGTAVEGPYDRVVVFGGVYNNYAALEALLDAAAGERAEALYCLGDLGGFGPHPQRVPPLLEQGRVATIQGNYEQSLAAGAEDCNCGYTDPRDNHFAALSYGYTAARCPDSLRSWMGLLPRRRRINVGGRELLLVHGSPRRVNEFLFHSTSPVAFLEVLLDQHGCDGLLCTHTGLHWKRRLPSGRDVANVGAIGRPANDGRTHVWYATVQAARDGEIDIALEPLDYDHVGFAGEMRSEELPEEFVETILSGWWTTCLEILPARERAASKY